jgi:hypothetical protein
VSNVFPGKRYQLDASINLRTFFEKEDKMKDRPAGITVIAVLYLIFGVLSLL